MKGKREHTSVEAAQPSGKIQSVGSRPSMIIGYYIAVSDVHVVVASVCNQNPYLYCKAVSWKHDAWFVVQMV